MKVSLVNVRRSEKPVVPLGLLYLAAVLERNGYVVSVHDVVFAEDEQQLIADLEQSQPQVVGFSFLTTAVDKTNRIIQELRSRLADTVFVAGGGHCTALPEDTLERLKLDYLIAGEGEDSLLAFCDSLRAGAIRHDISGLVYRKAGEVMTNPISGFVEDLDSLPLPAWHLIDMENYLYPPGYIKGLFYQRTVAVLTSRGCPARCTFCSSPNIFGRRIRRRSVDSVVAEIQLLKSRYHIDGVFFVDDTFTIDAAWVTRFCERMIAENLNLDWSCQTRVNVVSHDLLVRMKAAGCVQLDFGIESGSPQVLNTLKKGITPDQIRQAFRIAKDVGLRTYGSVLIGSPGETWDDVLATKALLDEVRPSLTLFYFVTPFPGSELYDQALANDWITGGTGKLFNYDIRTADTSLMISKMSGAELRRARSMLQNRFFFRNYQGLLHLRHLSFLLKLTAYALLHPFVIAQGLRKAIRNRAFDDFADAMYFAYCREKRLRRTPAPALRA